MAAEVAAAAKAAGITLRPPTAGPWDPRGRLLKRIDGESSALIYRPRQTVQAARVPWLPLSGAAAVWAGPAAAR